MKITPNNKLVYEVAICLIIAALFFTYGQGYTRNTAIGLFFSSLLLLFLYISKLMTFVIIERKKYITNKVFLAFGFSTKIIEITQIERNYEFIFKSWGCRMEVHYTDEYDFKQIGTIQESIYEIEDIKELLKTLKEINPSIKLHPQYQDLIDGKIEDEDGFKKMKIK